MARLLWEIVAGFLWSPASLTGSWPEFTSIPIRRCTGVALLARKQVTEHRCAPVCGSRPWAVDPGRIVANVLEVAAFELGNPVVFPVNVKAGDASVHGAYGE